MPRLLGSLATSAKRLVPTPAKCWVKRRMPGTYPAYCPVCDTRHEAFWPFGTKARPNALCPNCGALERHRLLWLYLTRQESLLIQQPVRLLHVAPEPGFGARLRQLPRVTYVSTDLSPDRAPQIRTDITRMGLADRCFDLVICSHVLEHVADDRAGMRECRRVVRPSGTLIVMVPLRAEPTEEDPNEADPAERARRFGQDDHVRHYGPDIIERLSEAGFEVSLMGPEQLVRPQDGDLGITSKEAPVIVCRPRPRD